MMKSYFAGIERVGESGWRLGVGEIFLILRGLRKTWDKCYCCEEIECGNSIQSLPTPQTARSRIVQSQKCHLGGIEAELLRLPRFKVSASR